MKPYVRVMNAPFYFVLFLFLFFIWAAIFLAILPLFSSGSFAERIVYSITLFGSLFILVGAAGAAMIRVSKPLTYDKASVPLDTSIFTRVVKERQSGEEHVIEGTFDTTFREACLSDWKFESVRKNEDWIIEDERRNDISVRKLSEYSSIAYLVIFEKRSF
ncbi:MAG: hypothetical protein ACFE7R_08655 [Candidatus Hodarchaeota archaeon]